MDIIKIQSQHDIPSGTWHWQYQGDLDAAVKRYVERFGEQPETVLVTETGLVAMPRQTQVIKISEGSNANDNNRHQRARGSEKSKVCAIKI